MAKELPGTPSSEPEAYGLAPLAPNGKRLPDSPPTVTKPRKVVNGRRDALAVIDRFLHAKTTRQRLYDALDEWLAEAPRSFIEKVMIPLTPKALVEEGIEKEEKERDAVIRIVTNVPRPNGLDIHIDTQRTEPLTIDVEGHEREG